MSENIPIQENKFFLLLKKYKKSLIAFSIILILFLFSFFILNEVKISNNEKVSDEFYKARILLQNGEKKKAKTLLNEIIKKRNNFYSPLSLNLYIENNLEEDENIIIEMFSGILKIKSLKKEDKNLYKLKFVIFLASKDKNEIEILDIINPVINSKSVWREPSIKFMREYYISKGQIERSKEFSKMLD